MKGNSIVIWLLRLIPSIILLQTLYFKFTAAPESVYIFSTLGVEPYGRILTGILELITAILILTPRTSWLGALMGIGIMGGAILSHFFKLGIIVQGDGGTLFILAVVVFTCCLILIWFHKKQIPVLKAYFTFAEQDIVRDL